MKKISILIAVLLLQIIKSPSQDVVDPPKILGTGTDTLLIDKRANSFIIGWNWSGPGLNLDECLSARTYHYIPGSSTDNNEYSTEMADSIKGIQVLFDNSTGLHLIGHNDNYLLNGMSLFLEPTTIIDTTDNFKMRWNDVSGGVFGFKYHNWQIGDTVSTGNELI